MINERINTPTRTLETDFKFARIVGWVAGGLFLLMLALQAIALS
jgi:hypothetical protein